MKRFCFNGWMNSLLIGLFLLGGIATSYAGTDLTVTVPAGAVEGDGLLTAAGTVTCSEAPSADLTVELSLDDASEILVPATVTVRAGQVSAAFDLTVIDDAEIDGTQTVTVTAAATEWTSGSTTIEILDNDGINFHPSIAAGGNHSLALKDDGTVWAWGYNYDAQLGDGTTTSRTSPGQVSGLIDVIDMAAGYHHTLALKTGGTVWTWGGNSDGQLGDGTNIKRTLPVQVTDLTNVIAIAAGYSHTLAIKAGGTVWAWGYNGNGQLGDGTNTNRTVPVQVTDLTNVIAIAAGYWHTLALRADGTVWAWGYNNYGQLGDGTYTNRTLPAQVTDLTNVIAIAAGYWHTLALKADGTVWAWGRNSDGQLGDGTNTNRTRPVQVSDLTNLIALAAGQYHTQALKGDGTVWSWGRNSYGQLGDGTTTNRSLPVQVSDLTNVIDVAAGNYHSLAVKADGTVWSWGYNGNGQLGDATTTSRTSPVKVAGPAGQEFLDLMFLSIVIPQSATEGDGVLESQGNVSIADVLTVDLIVNLASSDSSEVLVPADVIITVGNTSATFDVMIGDDTLLDGPQTVDISAVASGYYPTSVPIQVNDNETVTLSVDIPATATEDDGVLSGQGIITVSEAVDSDVTVSLGSDDTSEADVPNSVIIAAGQASASFDLTIIDDNEIDEIQLVNMTASVTGWISATATISIEDNETTDFVVTLPATATELDGLLTDAGVVSISGTLTSDLLVDLSSNNPSEVTVPARVTIPAGQTSTAFDMTVIDDTAIDGIQTATITATAPGWISGSDIIGIYDNEGSSASPSIAAASDHSVALNDFGVVWSWGENRYGEVGDGTTTERFTPVAVSDLANAIAIAAGYSHTIALKADGTVWAWGRNWSGQLGDGTNTDRTTPVQVADLTDLIAIAAGSFHNLALKGDGTVWAWGQNNGQLGDGTYANRTTPVPVAELTNVIAIAAGYNHSLALRTDGTVWAWGQNNYGQLGDGTNTISTTPVQVSNLTNVLALAAGSNHNLVLKADGTVWAWGRNYSGMLGDGTDTDKTTPVQVSNLTNVVAIAAGPNHNLASKADGTVWAWGSNFYGGLGDGTRTNSSAPVQVSNLTAVIAMAAGSYHSLALKVDGTVWAWGNNNHGQLGDGAYTLEKTPVQVNRAYGDGFLNLISSNELTILVSQDASEGDGVLSGTGTVSVSRSVSSGLVIDLTSNDTSEVTVPATVTIPEGQSSATFDLTIIEDTEIDETQTVTITASAAGWSTASDTIDVQDNEPRNLTVVVPASATEGDGMLGNAGTVSTSGTLLSDLVVDLTSNDASEVTVATTVTINAGQNSATFDLTIIDDTNIDGSQTASITASATGWTSGSDTINVQDNEPKDLTVAIPASATEGDGTQSNAGTVFTSGTLVSDLVVDLSSGDSSEVTVPTTVTIPAGQSSVTFDLTIIEDSEIDETQSVTITASATGWIPGSDTIDVGDNDNNPPNTPMNPGPANSTTDVALGSAEYEGYVFLSWSGGDPNEELGDTVTYDIYLGQGGVSTKVADNIGETNSWMTLDAGIEQGTTYYWQVTARDSAGLETMSPEWQFTTWAPDLVVAGITYAPATGILPNQEVTLTATIQNNGAGPAVDSFQVEFRIGGASIGNKTVSQILSGGESTQLTQTWTAGAGEHTIEVMADSAGTVSESDEDNNSLSQILPDIIDPTPPALTGTVPADGMSLSQVSEITFTLFDQYGSVDDAAVVASMGVTHGAGQIVIGTITESNDRFTFTPATLPFADGTYQVSFTAIDIAGNTRADAFSFTVDATPPAAPEINPVTSPTDSPTQLISGIKEAYARILLGGQEIVGHTPETTWHHTLNLQSGSNSFTFAAEDRAGNQSVDVTVEIFYDDIPPLAVETLTVSGEGDGTTATLDWSGYDEAAVGDVHFYGIYVETHEFTDVSGLVPNATVEAGFFTYTAMNLTEGTSYYFAVVPVDYAGNSIMSVNPVSGVPSDTDSDSDGVQNDSDNCPTIYNPDQTDNDSGYVYVPRTYFTEAGCETMCYSEYQTLNGIQFRMGSSTIGGKVPTIHGATGRTIDLNYHVDEVYILHPGGRAANTTLKLTFNYEDETSFAVDVPNPHDCQGYGDVGTNWERTHLGTYPCSGCCSNHYATTITNPTQALVTSITVSGSGGWWGTQINAITILKANDGTGDVCDNCPTIYNPDQLDGNNNGVGDACTDTTPPALMDTEPDDMAVLSQVSSIAFTLSEQHGIVHGTVDDAAVINSFSVIDGNSQPVSWTVTESDDQFTFTPDTVPMPDGAYQVSFTATDAAGNAQANSFSFTVDSQPPAKPTVTGGSITSGVIQPQPVDNRSNSTTVTLTGTREDNTSVWVNDVLKVDAGIGDWSVALTLNQGDNALEIWLLDTAGNRGPSTWVDITADTIAPVIKSVIPPNNSFVTMAPMTFIVNFNEAVSGLHLDNTTYSIKNENQTEINGAWKILSNNQLVFTPANTFPESTYTVNLLLEDNYTNRGDEAEYRFTVDSTPPPAPGINPVEATTHKVTQVITGTKEAYAAILLAGQEVVGNTAETTWQHTVSLDDVTNQFSFEAMDRAGNVSEEASVEIVLDDIAPPPVDNLWVNRQGNGTYVTLNWAGYDESIHGDIASYRIYVQNSDFSDVSALSVHHTVNAGTFSYRVNNLMEGETYYFAVVAVDVKGSALTTVTAVAGSPQIVSFVSGHITQNTTWTLAGSPYIVTGDVVVRYSSARHINDTNSANRTTLTIEPGVEIRFDPGTGLYVSQFHRYSDWFHGALVAQGTEALPIIFTSNATTPSPGDWKGVYFRDATWNGTTVLEHCVVEYGGHTNDANIYSENANPTIKNNIVRYSSAQGIVLINSFPNISNNSIVDNNVHGISLDSASEPVISGNDISNNGSRPINDIHPDGVRNLSGNVYANNGQNHIRIRGGAMTTNSTWVNCGIPYNIVGDVTVRFGSARHINDTNSANRTTLTIEPGVEIRFDPGTGLYVSQFHRYSDWFHGALVAQGTEGSPIIFTSNATTPSPGDWKGIYFRNATWNATTILEYCVVEYGGYANNAIIYSENANPTIDESLVQYSSGHGVYLNSASPKIINSSISHSAKSAIYLAGSSNPIIGGDGEGNVIFDSGTYALFSADAGPLPSVSYNTISNYGSYAMRMGARMKVHDNTYQGSGTRAIEVIGEHITGNTLWSNEIPIYIVLGDVIIRHSSPRHINDTNTANRTTLTIEPGVEIRFDPGSGLYVSQFHRYSDWYHGALVAQGTEGSPIIFTSNATTPSPGDWKGIYFRDATWNATTILEHCVVEYGGYANNANIYSENANPTIKNNIVRYSSAQGIVLINSFPNISNNSIVDNNVHGISLDSASEPVIYGNDISNNGNRPINDIHPDGVRNLSGNVYANNGQNHIRMRGGAITTNSTWVNCGIPYILTGDVTVRFGSARHINDTNSANRTTLTIEPGVEIRFDPGTGLYVSQFHRYSDWFHGALVAQGTEGSPIIFTSNATTPSPGDWKGIYFRDATWNGTTVLEHCVVEYGGNTNNANIYLENAKPTIQYNTIRNSSHSGIYINGTGANGAAIRCNNLKDNHYGVSVVNNAAPVIHDNNFLRNQNYGVNNTGSATVDARDNWWNDFNGPGFNGDDANGNVTVAPFLTAESDCIDTPPTNTAPFVPKNPVPANGAVRVPVMAEGQPVAVNLQWSGGDPNPWDAVVYDIYLGSAADSLTVEAEGVATASYDKTGLEGGNTYYWKIVARDDAGAETAGAIWHFTTLGDPPDLVISTVAVSPQTDLQAGQTITFTATLENTGRGPVVDAFRVEFFVNGQSIGYQTINPVMPAGNSVQVSRSWTAVTGDHAVEARADSQEQVVEAFEENNTFAVSLPHVKDPTPPDLTQTVPAANVSVKQASAVTFTLADQHGVVDTAAVIASVVVIDGGGSVVAGTVSEADNRYTFAPAAVPLADGTYTVSFIAKDLEGNTKEYNFTFTVDGQPPAEPAITGGVVLSGLIQIRPAENKSKTATVILTGSREDNTAIYINNQKKRNFGSGNWSASLTLAQGANVLEIRLQDAAGNSSPSVTVDVTVDSKAPSIGAMTPASGSFINTTPAAITVAFSETGSGLNLEASQLSVKDTNQQPVEGTWAVSGADQLVFTPTAALEDSLYTVDLRLEDNFTNRSTAKHNSFTLDTKAPAAPVVSPVSSPTHKPSQTLSGTKEAYAALQLNGSQIVGHSAQTTWTYSASLSAGDNSFTFAARDKAGNQSDPVTVAIFFDDVPPPAVNTLSLDPEGDGRTIKLDWSGYNEAAHGDVSGYRIYRSTATFADVSAAEKIGSTTAGNFKYTATDLTRATTYWFAVVAVDAQGNARAEVTPVSGSARDIVPPENVSSLKVQSFANQLTFTWTQPADTHGDLAGYRITFADAAPLEQGKDESSFTKGGLSFATGYSFKVIAYDNDNNQSSGKTITGVTLLENPTNLAAEVHSGYVDLSWDAVLPANYVKHYAVYRSESDFTDVAGITPVLTSTKTSAKLAGLTNDTTYYIAVTAVNISDGEQTTVTTIAAVPEADSKGPEITNIRIDDDQLAEFGVLNHPVSFSCEAQDAAGVSRVEFFIDGKLVRTDYNALYSCFWNVVETADGAHTLTIAAYDTLGNRTSEDYSLTVTLAAPEAPQITAPAGGTITNKKTITVTGQAEKYTDISLYNNGVETGVVVAVDAFGKFSTLLSLSEGENRLQAAAENRADMSPKSTEVAITLDTTLPVSPTNLVAEAKSGGSVRLTWKAPSDTEVTGYNLYRASAPFTTPQGAGKINTNLIQATAFDDLPPSDGTWYYRVSTVDAAANESDLSAEALARADGTAPRASAIDYSPQGAFDTQTGTMAPGTVNVVLAVTEPLQSNPYLSIAPDSGIPISVQLNKDTDTTYSGFFVINDSTPSGTAYAIFSARDVVGNRGTQIDAGGAFQIDTDGPSVTRLVVSPPAPIKSDEQSPVAVTVVFGLDEKIKATESAQLSYLLSGAQRELIDIDSLTELAAQAGDVQTWQAHFDLPADAGLTGAEMFYFIYQGRDALDNASDRLLAANIFQVYQGELPPLTPPLDFKAVALPGGKIRLTWLAVDQAAGYQVYRKAPDESELAAYARLDAVQAFEDAPAEDGSYTYAIASIRQENTQEALSGLSDPVVANSDAVAPGAPLNLALELVANGIKVAWQLPVYTEDITYALYRSGEEITTVDGLVPLAADIGQTLVVDPTPSLSDHWYAVTAVDAVGNESGPSNAEYLNVQLLPVSGITVVQADNQPPAVTWTHPGGDIAGYDIYLGTDNAPVKLNKTLLTAKGYTDTGYSRDQRRYTVITVDNSDVESLGRSITLPVLRAVLSDGSRIKRGIMNRLDYVVLNEGAGRVENIRLNVRVGSHDHTSEPFDLDPGTSRTIPVVVGGYDDLAEGMAALTTIIEVIPRANETVQIIRSGQIQVADGLLGLQILNEEFTRAASGQVQFTIENTGDAEIEIVTAKNSGNTASDQVAFYLLDEDDNVLSTQAFKQATGDKLVSLSNKNTVARIPAGETFTSEMISMPVPANAPDDVIIRLDIDHVYYHQGQATQVKMDGLSTTHAVTLVDTAYYGELLDITPQTSTGGEDIVITGQAVERSTDDPMANVPLKLVITLDGFERSYDVYTGENGAFTHRFKPLSGESGIYRVRVVHPDLTDKPMHGQFVINKVAVTPAALNLNAPKNYTSTIQIRVQTGDGTSVSDLHLEYAAVDQPTGEKPVGIYLTPGEPVAQLGGNQTAYLPFTIWADNTADQTGKLVLKVKSAESAPAAWGTVTINTYFSQAKPVLSFTPNRVETGMALDDTVAETVTLKNNGLADMHDVQLSLLNPNGTQAPTWVYLSSTTGIKSLAIGNTQQVGVTFAPTSAVAEGDYAFKLRVEAANHAATDINLYAAVTQSGTGNIQFKLSDIYTGTNDQNGFLVEGLAGARVKLQNEKTLSIEYSQNSDSIGEAYFDNIPAGPYKCRITASNHQEYTGRVWIKPGVTVNKDVFLDYNLVTVEWQVNEITIEDKYEIVLSATYETNVPAAVVVVEPASVTLPKMKAGDVYNGEFTLTNYGLIPADDLTVTPPGANPYFDYEVLGGLPENLEAKESITVPYRVTSLKSPDEEGSGCQRYSDCWIIGWDYKCVNGVVTESAIKRCEFYDNGRCTGTTAGPTVIKDGGVLNFGTPTGGKGTVSSPAPAGKPISGAECVPSLLSLWTEFLVAVIKDPSLLLEKETWAYGWQLVGCRVSPLTREFSDYGVDLSVKVPNGTISIERLYYQEKWHWEHTRNNLIFEGNPLTGEIDAINKGGIRYERSSGSSAVYLHHTFRIEKLDAGYRWEDRWGNWKAYDETGRMTGYGNIRGVLAQVVYEDGQDGKAIGLTDRNDTQVIWFEYNSDGLISAVEDGVARRVEYAYEDGLLIRITDVLDQVTTYEYDEKGRVRKKVDSGGRPTLISYNDYGHVSKVVDRDGVGHFFEYHWDDRKDEYYASITTSSGRVKEIWFDGKGEAKRMAVNGRTIETIRKDGRNLFITDEKGHVTGKEFDEWDNLTRILNSDGAELTFEFNHSFNKVTKFIDPRGYITAYDYDQQGNLISKIEALGTTAERTTTYTYDQHNQLLSATVQGDADTERAATWFTYDETGNVKTITDPEQNTTEFQVYDNMGNLLKMKDPRGYIWHFDYDEMGRLISRTDPVNITTAYEYDGANNRTAIINAYLKRFEFEYDDHNNLIKAIDPYQNYVSTKYSTDNLPVKTTDQEGKEASSEYDNEGRVTKSIDGAGNEIRYVYDESQETTVSSYRPVEIHYPTYTQRLYYDELQQLVRSADILDDGTTYTRSYSYDESGNVLTETDEEGNTTTYEYDALSRLIKVIDPMEGVTERSYDARGNLITLKDPNGGITGYEYDRNNRLIKMNRPMDEATVYEYDEMGNNTAVYDAKGQKISYEYNAINKLVTVRYYDAVDHDNPVKTVNFVYDKLGNLESYDDGITSGTYTYDDLQRKIKEEVDFGSFKKSLVYTYYANGMKRSFTGPNGTTYTYNYDANNRMTVINIPGRGPITYNTYRWNSPMRISIPGGSTTEYTHDPLMQVKGILASDPGGNSVFSRTYKYSPVGNTTEKITEHGTYTYGYDSLHRLEQATNPTLSNEAYTYDKLGNRLTSAAIAGNWIYNLNNELLSFADTSFNYDANGNMSSRAVSGEVTFYQYDGEDRMTQVEQGVGNVIAEYYYDPFGRRLWKDVSGVRTYYFYCDEGLAGEYDGAGAELRTYGWAPHSMFGTYPLFVRIGDQYYWYRIDYQGTPQKIIDGSGHVVWSAVYDAFGKAHIQVEEITNNLRFAGQYLDAETGLHYNLFRYYDPVLGRYLRTDPYAEGLNLYIYVFNNPGLLVDPLGLCSAHIILGGLGMLPGIGIVFDLADAALSLFEGDYVAVAVATAASIPLLGQATRIASIGRMTRLNKVARMGRFGPNATNLARKSRSVGRNVQRFADDAVGAGTSKTLNGAFENAVDLIPGCFGVGTLINTVDGLRPIEEIEPGDLVLARNEHTGELEYREVVRTFVRENQEIVELELEDDEGQSENIRSTVEHPFWVKNHGWTAANALLPGDEVFTSAGGWIRITGGTWLSARQTVYNFEVDGFHNYFVGLSGAWVHNTSHVKLSNSASKSGIKQGQVASEFPRGRRVGGRKAGVKSTDPPSGFQESGAWDLTPENLARMELGRPPIGKDNIKIQLHHRNQNPAGPLDEYSATTHRTIPNPVSPSRINRNKFAGERSRYWVQRARQLLGQD